MKTNNLSCVLTIAGTDPSGGAGIQADIKTISALGGYAASVITALVAQNTQGVQAIFEIPADFVTQQLHSVFTDLNIIAVKIGMLHNEDVIAAITKTLQLYKPKFIVLDPVMVAKDGSALIKMETIDVLMKQLFPIATLITPNLFEAEKIANCKINDLKDMKNMAKSLAKKYHINVLIKGGHLDTSESIDVLYTIADNKITEFIAPRIHTQNTHGTGCTLSSAIATYLAQDYSLVDAISLAKNYLNAAIHAGSQLKIGKGNGPVHHFYGFTAPKSVT